MEANLTLRETLTSVINKSGSNKFINEEIRQPLIEFSEKFNVDLSGKKLNLTFFGNVSVGKTTLINHFIRHLITQRNNKVYSCQTVKNKSAPTTSTTNTENQEEEEEEENCDGFIELSTKDIENTYFISLVENSESEDYEIILEVNNKEDQDVLMKINSFKDKQYDDKNQIIFKFSNNENGIKAINKFLDEIDYKCLHLIKSRRVIDVNKDQQIQEEFSPSKMIIKIPDFPKEYRLIDSPGLSIATFRKAFINMINDLDYINYFLIINDIYAKESYSLTDDIVKEVANDYGPPIIYYFITKGNKFLKEFPKINKDYKAYVRINNIKIKDLDETKEKINFRKVIPINDKHYNEDVKNCLNVFFDDLDQITKEYGISNFENSVMFRLRRKICQINDTSSKDSLFSEKEIKIFQRNADNAQSFYEKQLRDYFEKFTDDFTSFKNRFPDLLNDLYKVYEKHDRNNDHDVVRLNYIQKHIELSSEDFQTIILKKPKDFVIAAFNQFYQELDEDSKNKILQRFQAEGFLDENSNNVNMGAVLLSSSLVISGGIPLIGFIALRGGFALAKGIATLVGSLFIPIVGTVIGIGGLIFSASDFLGLWKRENTREDITRVLLKWLSDNKGKIIKDSLKGFADIIKILLQSLTDFKVFEKWTEDLINECNNFKPNSKPFPFINYKEELLKTLSNQRLKNFFSKVFDYQEEKEEEK